MLLSTLILDPAHSILTQSYDSRLRLVLTSRACPSESVTDNLRILADLTMETALALATIRIRNLAQIHAYSHPLYPRGTASTLSD